MPITPAFKSNHCINKDPTVTKAALFDWLKASVCDWSPCDCCCTKLRVRLMQEKILLWNGYIIKIHYLYLLIGLLQSIADWGKLVFQPTINKTHWKINFSDIASQNSRLQFHWNLFMNQHILLHCLFWRSLLLLTDKIKYTACTAKATGQK